MKEKVENVKNHLRKYRKVYIAAGACAAIGFIAGALYIKTYGDSVIMTRFWSPGDNNLMKVYINPLGDPGNVVQCVETGTIYASQGQAAKELGVSAARVSQHLNGSTPNLFGNHLIILGKAGEVLAEKT